MLLGRIVEQAQVSALLDGARAGGGGALVIRGDAGIGKTALLEQAFRTGVGMRVLRGTGIESEIELPFAFLHLLLHPHLERIDALPAVQARALRAAWGMEQASTADRFLVGLAVLSLLSELADDGPLLCVVDDAQWVDDASADALLFAARRLGHTQAAMIFGARGDAARFREPGVDVLTLAALDRATAVALLDERARTVAGPVRARILAEARGNPLAIIEFSAAVTARRGGQRATPVEPLPVAGRVREAFLDRIDELPPATQRMLQLAAADDSASVAVISTAGARLGLSYADLEPAERERLVELGPDTVSFRHPLIRTAAYRPDRRDSLVAAHRALAEVLGDDPDRRAWHLAAATTGPDEAVAGELERAASRAASRGGRTTAATALERAAELTADPERRGGLLVAAARAAFDAGWLDRASRLVEEGARLVVDPSTRADAAWIDAQIAYESDSPARAAELAVQGARAVVASHPVQAASMLCDASGCAKDACRPDLLRASAELLDAVAPGPDAGSSAVRTSMAGLADWLDEPGSRAATAMRTLVVATRDGEADGLVERILGGYLALIVGDDDDGVALLDALAADTRRLGALAWLPYAQEPLAIAHLLGGRFRDAETVATEALAVSADLGQRTQTAILTAVPAWLAALADDEGRCLSLAARARNHGSGHPVNAALADWAVGLLDLGRGRFAAAVARLGAVVQGPARHDFLIRAVPDHVEAAVRAGRPAPGASVLERWAEYTGHAHVAGLVARCRALRATDATAARFYDEALQLHRDAGRVYDGARTALLYGEWLRRQRRRGEARTQLRDAMITFEGLGAPAWTTRARTELEALGDRPVAQAHDRDPLARLSPQERQVVALAAAGLSNREIAAQLFLSHRTVEHHLYRSYPKLGVTGRRDLGSFADR